MPDAPLILVVDDDDAVRRSCVEALHMGGYRTQAAATVRDGLKLFKERPPAAAVLDLRLPDGTGIDVLRALQRHSPGTPVVIVSGQGNVSDAVETMRIGASDYLEKPVAHARLLEVLARLLDRRPGSVDSEPLADGSRYGMVGRCEAMARVYQLVEMAAPTKCRVFVSGESGTGKELVARALHALSPRRERPFIEVNCAAIPQELIESEMFGHVKGAFTGAVADRKGTFEAAHTGTLFLDEIGDMSLTTQAKLLRALQENEVAPVGSSERRSVDVRVIAATSKNLPDEIARGAFRADLYYRINVVTIALPPLRQRREDIPELAAHFVRVACLENGLPPKRLTSRALDLLCQLDWKGNVRELCNLMERLAVLVVRDVVTHRDVAELLQLPRTAQGEDEGASPSLREARARFERDYIAERLAANGGHLGRTAHELGIERTNLYRKMRQLGIRGALARVRPS
jgi:two-component system nitrogen regulation response regulator NtrX